MRVQIIESDRKCPRCHKRLAQNMGQNDTEGDLEAELYCLNDGYREMQRPERDRTSDGSPFMASLRDKVRDPKPVTAPAAIQAIIEEAS